MPDISFKLFGDATSIERAVARASSSLKDLERKTANAQRALAGLGRAAAPAVAIGAAFLAGANNAQRLRDEAEKSGKALDANLAAAARFGDTIDAIASGAMEFFSKSVGSIVRHVENLVFWLNKINPDAFRAEEDAAKRRAAYLKAEKEVGDEIAKIRKSGQMAEASESEKINLLLADNVALLQRISSLADDDRKRAELKGQIEKNNLEIRKASLKVQEQENEKVKDSIDASNEVLALRKQEAAEKKEMSKKRASASGGIAEATGDLTTFKRDRSNLSLQELAGVSPFSVGFDSETVDAGRDARSILDTEAKAESRRKVGDRVGADELFGQAGVQREALLQKGFGKSNEGDPAKALQKEVQKQTEILESIDAKFGGVAE